MNTDCLKEIVKFLDWIHDFNILNVIVDIFKLSTHEKDQIVAYWKSHNDIKIVEYTYKKIHYCYGKKHRHDGPAVEYKGGKKEYWFDGQLHRLDGPAIEYEDKPYTKNLLANKLKVWYVHGIKHRIDGPATIDNSGVEWRQNGLRHRIGGPAVIWSNGDREWWVNGKRHRTDGPAIIRKDEQEWWINGKLQSNKKFAMKSEKCVQM